MLSCIGPSDIDYHGGSRRVHWNRNLLGNGNTLSVTVVQGWQCGRSLPWLGPHGLQSIDVLMETRTDVVPQRIEHDVQTLATREFRRRYEIGVSGDQHNSFYQSLIRL